MAKEAQDNRIEWLDALRGFACLIVFTAHVIARYPATVEYSYGVGKLGVWFFMVSAGWMLLKHLPERMSGAWLPLYYLKKLLRLWPALLVGVLLTWQADIIPWGKDILLSLVFLKGPAHLWYVPVVAAFYLIAPLILFLYKKTDQRAVSAILLVLTGLLFSLVFPFTKYPENDISLKWYLPVFLMGALLVCLPKGKVGKGLWDMAAILLLGCMTALTPPVLCGLFHYRDHRFLPNKYLLIGALWTGILYAVSSGKYMRKGLEKCRPLILFSRVSYPFYLVHYPVIILIKREWDPGEALMFPIAFIASLILAAAIRLLLEKPLMQLGKRVAK